MRIRHAVVAGLKAEATAAGDRVYGNRLRPLWNESLPAILVFTRDESPIELFQVSPRIYRRVLRLAIVVVDQEDGPPAIDDRLDLLASAVESFAFRDPYFGLRSLAFPDIELEGAVLDQVEHVLMVDEKKPERKVQGQRITFRVPFLDPAIEGDPADVRDFTGVGVEWRLKPGDEIVDARDVVDLVGLAEPPADP